MTAAAYPPGMATGTDGGAGAAQAPPDADLWVDAAGVWWPRRSPDGARPFLRSSSQRVLGRVLVGIGIAALCLSPVLLVIGFLSVYEAGMAGTPPAPWWSVWVLYAFWASVPTGAVLWPLGAWISWRTRMPRTRSGGLEWVWTAPAVWPPAEEGWTPPPGWAPDPGWGAPPPGWRGWSVREAVPGRRGFWAGRRPGGAAGAVAARPTVTLVPDPSGQDWVHDGALFWPVRSVDGQRRFDGRRWRMAPAARAHVAFWVVWLCAAVLVLQVLPFVLLRRSVSAAVEAGGVGVTSSPTVLDRFPGLFHGVVLAGLIGLGLALTAAGRPPFGPVGGRAWTWTPPPGWPVPPAGFRPWPGWRPDPRWPAPPVEWRGWTLGPAKSRRSRSGGAA